MASRGLILGVVVVIAAALLWWGVRTFGLIGGVGSVASDITSDITGSATGEVTIIEPTAAPTAAPTAGEAADVTPEAAEAATPAAAAAPAAQVIHFQIDPGQSTARFIVAEVLFGNPNTVIGSTSEVSGTLDVDLGDPAQTQIGPIRVNARSLATDNRFRNRSLSRFILQSNQDAFQYITFTPTAIAGLPAAAQAGDVMELQVTGDLQIRDITQPVTFTTVVTATSASQINGFASTTVQRADFGLTIPKVDGVADVTEEVRLEVEFVALAAE